MAEQSSNQPTFDAVLTQAQRLALPLSAPAVRVGYTVFESDTGSIYVVGVAAGSVQAAPTLVWVSLAQGSSPSVQSQIYMSPTGNDANPGTQAAPVLTLAAALALVPNGYRGQVLVIAASGTYPTITNPTGAAVRTFSFAPSGSGEGFPPASIVIVGGLSPVANAHGSSFVTTGPSTVPADGIGVTLPTAGTTTADEYLGAQLLITASSTGSLVGRMAPVGFNDGAGSSRIVAGLGATIPTGTTFVLVRPNVTFPFAGRAALTLNGGSAQCLGINWQRDPATAAFVPVDVEVWDGTMTFMACEFDLGDGANKLGFLQTGYGGTIVFSPQQIAYFGETYAQLAVGGVTPALSQAGCYVHAGSYSAPFRGIYWTASQTQGKCLNNSVFLNVDCTHGNGTFQMELCENVGGRVSVGANGISALAAANGNLLSVRFRDSAAGVGSPLVVTGGSAILLSTLALDNWGASSGISVLNRALVVASTVRGTGAGSSIRGWLLSNQAQLQLSGAAVTLAGVGGVDIRLTSPASNSNVDLLYAQVATNVLTTDCGGPQSSGCQVQKL